MSGTNAETFHLENRIRQLNGKKIDVGLENFELRNALRKEKEKSQRLMRELKKVKAKLNGSDKV